jgi:20S proteasome alpha/beta subunit
VTLLVALKADNGLVLAADSRGTFGDPRGVTAQNDSQEKARVLAPHVAVLMAGAGELGTHVVKRATDMLTGKLMAAQQVAVGPAGATMVTVLQAPPDGAVIAIPQDGITPVMGTLREASRASYGEWFPSVQAVPAPGPAQAGQIPTRPDLQFIVAGYEMGPDGVGDAQIYSLQSGFDFAPSLHDYGFAVAGVPTYALYLLNRLCQVSRSVEDLTALAAYVITETASQDGKVGGPVSVIQVTPAEGCTVLDAAQVQAIIDENEKRSAALRDSFYEHGDSDADPT